MAAKYDYILKALRTDDEAAALAAVPAAVAAAVADIEPGDIGAEVAGAAAAAVSAHELDHPAPTNRDTRNEAAGTAAGAVSAHELNHPAPTTRDARNAVAGAGDAGDAHAAIVTGNPHGTTAGDIGAAPASHGHANTDVSGLGTAATLDVGTGSSDVAAGNRGLYTDISAMSSADQGKMVQFDASMILGGDANTGVLFTAENGFTDSGPNSLAITNVGGCTLETTNPLFGNASLRLNGSNYLTIADSSDLDLVLGKNFCIEGAFQLNTGTLTPGILVTIVSAGITSSAPNQAWVLYIADVASVQYLRLGLMTAHGTWTTLASDPLPAIQENTRYYVAASCTNNTVRFWLDGVEYGGGTFPQTISPASGGLIGALNAANPGWLWAGLLDEVQISQNIDRLVDGVFVVPTVSRDQAIKRIVVADAIAVTTTGDQTIAGIKTFSSYPLLPEAAPTTDRQAVPKGYLGTMSTQNANNVAITGGSINISGGTLTLADGQVPAAKVATTEMFVVAAPSPTSTGIPGQRHYAGNYVYECVATNTWVRYAAESTWS